MLRQSLLVAIVSLLALVSVPRLSAQRAGRGSLTPAQLEAKVAALEQEIAQLRGEYQLIVTNCQTTNETPLPPVEPRLPPLPPPTLPTTSAGDRVRAKCAKDWPTDFRMQAYCVTKQVEAMRQIDARGKTGVMNTPAGATILEKCARDWPGDFAMVNYCIEQQLKALATLR